MQIRTEYTIGSDSLHGKVQSAHLIGFAPLLLAVALRHYQPYLLPHLVGTILWLCVGHQLVLWGSYNLIFHEELVTRSARRLQTTARLWFPALLTATRYAFFVLCFTLLWIALRTIGVKFSILSTVTFFLTMFVLPVHKLISEFIPEGRGRLEFRLRRSLLSLRTWSTTLLVLAYVTDRFDTELAEGNTPVPVSVVWLIGTLVLAGSFILWLDEMLHPERRRNRSGE